ncbi:hypothetical protein KIN20_027389 [Parelaphostrongylus tenuis]|uniref:Uncharacterized protein n=1 Tax=Parelaphostrongylus tenuis TaxID=148309 RepID=A0AAD5QZA3_PARTN|nr:hypothetical protein KIN20_027389 [Parelaphostrongylus tenuis]
MFEANKMMGSKNETAVILIEWSKALLSGRSTLRRVQNISLSCVNNGIRDRENAELLHADVLGFVANHAKSSTTYGGTYQQTAHVPTISGQNLTIAL